MPAGLKEAFKSYLDDDELSHTNKNQRMVRNVEKERGEEIVSNGDFNTNYKLPKYQPTFTYPAMHPISDNCDPKNPQQDAGWIKTTEPCYLQQQLQPQHNGNGNGKGNGKTTTDDDLLNKVMSSKYCRRILKKIFKKNNNIVETFSNSNSNSNNITIDPTTIKNIIIYCLGGLILLCIFEIIVQIMGH